MAPDLQDTKPLSGSMPGVEGLRMKEAPFRAASGWLQRLPNVPDQIAEARNPGTIEFEFETTVEIDP